MKEGLLEILRCPDCLKEFAPRVRQKSGEEIVEGDLDCQGCHQSYPIHKSIPRMLKIEKLKKTDRAMTRVKSRYEYEWKMFPNLFDCGEESKAEFFSLVSLAPEDLIGRRVCDLGCGWGRHVRVAARYAREVVALDLSEAGLERAKILCGSLGNVHFVMGDVTHAPFEEQTFDFSYCLAVLTFLPDPLQGFREVCRITTSSGAVAIYVLRRKSNWYEWLDRATRPLMSTLPNVALHGLSKVLTPLIPMMKQIKGTQVRRQTEGAGHVFDWLSSPLHHAHHLNEVLEWFESVGIHQLRYSEEAIGVTGWKSNDLLPLKNMVPQ